jgi:hypothetical protein
MPKFIDHTGQRFGRWTVIERGPDWRPGVPAWRMRCDCGNEKTLRAQTFVSGASRSCGCLNNEVRRSQKNTLTHGLTRTRAWNAWVNMRQRCENPKASGYHKYGARGISVCERWAFFENFIADMGQCPPGWTLDRIDGTKGYSKENCRWATQKAQQNNRLNNSRLTLDGRTQTIAQWAAEIGIARHSIRNRLNRGLSIRDVLSPVRFDHAPHSQRPKPAR